MVIDLALSTSTNSRAATNYIEILASERQSTPGDIHFFIKTDSDDLKLDENDMKLFKSFETAKQNIKSSTELQESFDEISDIKLYGYLEKRVLKKKIKKRNYEMSY